MALRGVKGQGPLPSETSVRRRKNLHASFAESLIPPKQLTQPQKKRPTPQPNASKKERDKHKSRSFFYLPVLPKPPTRSESTSSSSAKPWGRKIPWQKRSPLRMVTSWLPIEQGL